MSPTTAAAQRRAIYIDGFAHKNPVPHACRIGDLLVSGLVAGADPATGAFADDLDTQCRHLFAHIAAICDAAGMSCDDIIRLTFWAADMEDRSVLNEHWLAMFPDPQSRPARQVNPKLTASRALITAEFTAVARGGLQPQEHPQEKPQEKPQEAR